MDSTDDEMSEVHLSIDKGHTIVDGWKLRLMMVVSEASNQYT